MQNLITYYDLLNQPGPDFPWSKALIICSTLLFGRLIYIHTKTPQGTAYKNKKYLAFLMIGAIIWLEGAPLWNENQRLNECLAWRQNGDYQIAEGKVSQFKHDSSKSPKWESFQVGNQAFKYNIAEKKGCGFNQTQHQGGPLQAGKWVRIAHHQGVILKLEIRP